MVAGEVWACPSPRALARLAGTLLPTDSARRGNVEGEALAAVISRLQGLPSDRLWASAVHAVVEALLRAGADPRTAGRGGVTPLHRAAYACATDVARLLLSYGADAGVPDTTGVTPLMVAAARGCVSMVHLLWEGQESSAPCGWGRLHRAAALDSAELVGEARRAGSSPHETDALGYTPLHIASALAAHAAVEALLRVRADPITRAVTTGETPAHLAARAGRSLVLTRLGEAAPKARRMRDGARQTIAHTAALHGEAECLAWALAARRVTDTMDDFGATPLHRAATSFCPEAVRVLVRHGCNTNLAGAMGHTALHSASEAGCAACAQELIQSGADLDPELGISLMTPLHMAALYGHASVARVLLAAGASGRGREGCADRPSALAAAAGYHRLAAWLDEGHVPENAEDWE